jgi:hypothetical protein
MELTALERAVLDRLFAGDHPSFLPFRAQVERVRVIERTFSGVGFFSDLVVPEDVSAASGLATDPLWWGDVYVDFDGLAHGGGFVIRIADGRLEMLEGFTFDEPWPAEGTGFRLRHEPFPRQLDMLG